MLAWDAVFLFISSFYFVLLYIYFLFAHVQVLYNLTLCILTSLVML